MGACTRPNADGSAMTVPMASNVRGAVSSRTGCVRTSKSRCVALGTNTLPSGCRRGTFPVGHRGRRRFLRMIVSFMRLCRRRYREHERTGHKKQGGCPA